MEANGSLARSTSTTDGAFFKDLTAFELKAGLDPVMVPISPNTQALLAGVAHNAVLGLVQLAVQAGFSGQVSTHS